MVSITTRRGGFDTGQMPEKILALTRYDATILSRVHTGENKMLIERGAANLVSDYFMRYIDATSRANRKSFHHVYEWDMTGDSDARLFKKKITTTAQGTLMSFSFTNSKTKNRDGYIFAKKAEVMESGQKVIITPKRKSILRFFAKSGDKVFTELSVVYNPGGDFVKNSFTDAWKKYSRYNAKATLRQFKYFESVNEAIKLKRKSIVPRISRGMISGMEQQALKDAGFISTKAAVVTGG